MVTKKGKVGVSHLVERRLHLGLERAQAKHLFLLLEEIPDCQEVQCELYAFIMHPPWIGVCAKRGITHHLGYPLAARRSSAKVLSNECAYLLDWGHVAGAAIDAAWMAHPLLSFWSTLATRRFSSKALSI